MQAIFYPPGSNFSRPITLTFSKTHLVLNQYGNETLWDINKVHKKIEKSKEGYIIRYADESEGFICVSDKETIHSLRKKYNHSGIYIAGESVYFKRIIVTLLVLFFLFIGGLAALYIWGIDWVSEKLAHRLPIEQEEAIGQKLYEQTIAGYQKDDSNSLLVDSFFKTLNYQSKFHIHIVVVKSEEVNAFALPGGYIFVMSKMLDKIKEPQELAALLSHELSHINERHAARGMIRNLGASAFLSVLFGDLNEGAVLVGAAENLKSLQYSRSMESEADSKGFDQMMATKKYTPEGMIDLFKILLSSTEGQEPPQFLSTHPNIKERLTTIQNRIKNTSMFTINPSVSDTLFKAIKNK